jgi:GGDEF domain-containing protein
VAATPVDALLARVEDLTKGWLLALLEQRALEDAPAILAADAVRDGPRLCDAIIRALADDHDLRRLEPGGALERLASRAGEMTGTTQAEPSVGAVDALRAVIWSALREELVRPDADLVAALAERLALVTELVRAAVLRRFGDPGGITELAGVGGGEPAVGGAVPDLEAVGGVGEPDGDDAPAGSQSAGSRSAGSRSAGSRSAGSRPAGGEVPDISVTRTASPRPVAEGPVSVSSDSLWRGALDDEVARAQRSGAKLALLLAELSDADRVAAVEPVQIAGETFSRFARAVRSALRREDILACETESRAWIIARATGRTGARALGSRIASAVQETEPWRGAPLTVGIGIAILGEDAHDATGLVEAADEWTFAAVSAGLAIAESPDHAGEDESAVDGDESAVDGDESAVDGDPAGRDLR